MARRRSPDGMMPAGPYDGLDVTGDGPDRPVRPSDFPAWYLRMTGNPSTASWWLRAVLAASVSVAAALCAALSAFFAYIVYSGCFMSCRGTDAQRGQGMLLVVLTGVLVAVGPFSFAFLFRSKGWLQATGWTFGVVVVTGAAFLAQLPVRG